MPVNSRAKGARGELEAAKVLGEKLGLELKRVYGQSRQGDDAPDIDGPGLGMFCEVKLGKSHRIENAMRQAIAGAEAEWKRSGRDRGMAKRRPMVVSREDRGEWLVTVRLADLGKIG